MDKLSHSGMVLLGDPRGSGTVRQHATFMPRSCRSQQIAKPTHTQNSFLLGIRLYSTGAWALHPEVDVNVQATFVRHTGMWDIPHNTSDNTNQSLCNLAHSSMPVNSLPVKDDPRTHSASWPPAPATPRETLFTPYTLRVHRTQHAWNTCITQRGHRAQTHGSHTSLSVHLSSSRKYKHMAASVAPERISIGVPIPFARAARALVRIRTHPHAAVRNHGTER